MIYLSVIIPVRNEEKYIVATLSALAQQDYPKDRVELLVVDGMSTDKTIEKIKHFMKENPETQITITENPGLLSSRARNIGAKKANGTLVAIIDAHVYIPNDLLFKNMETMKEQTGALALSRPAPLDVPEIKSGMAYWIAQARKSKLGHSKRSFIYSDFEGFVDPVSSGFAYDRKVFQDVGYFDESFDAAEDVEFHHRLKETGIQAYTSPKFLIYSYPRNSLRELFKQQTRYGEGRARFIGKHRSGFTLETLIPTGIFLYFSSIPFALLLSDRAPVLFVVYIFPALVYLMILFATGTSAAVSLKKPVGGVFITLAILVTHLGLGWGFLKSVLLLRSQ